MAYDEQLDARVRGIVEPWGAERKTMFGGTGYMIGGHLAAGVYKDRLLIRLSEEGGAEALTEPGVTPFDMMKRPMPGWVTVGQEELGGENGEDVRVPRDLPPYLQELYRIPLLMLISYRGEFGERDPWQTEGGGVTEAAIKPPTSVCVQGTLNFEAFDYAG